VIVEMRRADTQRMVWVFDSSQYFTTKPTIPKGTKVEISPQVVLSRQARTRIQRKHAEKASELRIKRESQTVVICLSSSSTP